MRLTKKLLLSSVEAQFFGQYQIKPKASNSVLRAQGKKSSPVICGSRKQEAMTLGHQLGPKMQFGPLNLNPMSAAMTSDHSK